MGHSTDVFEHHTLGLMDIIWGSRRHSILLGADANVRLIEAHATTVDTALGTGASTIPSAERDNAAIFSTELAGHTIRAPNTFETLWAAPKPAGHQSATWAGPIYQALSHRATGYAITHSVTAQLMSSSVMNKGVSHTELEARS